MKSKPVKIGGKMFRYDFDRSLVEYIQEATDSQIGEEIEWEKKHGSKLHGIGADGYIVLASAGLNAANWKNAAARKEYLSEWANELAEEESCLVADFVKYELPYLKEETK